MAPGLPCSAAWTQERGLPLGRCRSIAPSGGTSPGFARLRRLQPLQASRGPARQQQLRQQRLQVSARQDRPRRLVSFVFSAPLRVEQYFEKYPLRKILWSGIALCAGFYAGNVVTLSFGALAINDVLAAVVTLAFYEAVTFAFYRAKVRTLRLYFANYFKIGVTAAMLADALKLGG